MTDFYNLVPSAPHGRYDGIERSYAAEDVKRLRGSVEIRHSLAEMGRGFKAPLRRNIDAWKAVELLHAAGFRFPSTERRACPPLPTKLRDVAAFIEANPCHPYRTSVT